MRLSCTSLGCSTSARGALDRTDLGAEEAQQKPRASLGGQEVGTGVPWRVTAGQGLTYSCLETMLSTCKAELRLCFVASWLHAAAFPRQARLGDGILLTPCRPFLCIEQLWPVSSRAVVSPVPIRWLSPNCVNCVPAVAAPLFNHTLATQAPSSE